MSKMAEAATISSAIATSISEDRTVDVRVPVEALGNLDWIEELIEGVEDFDYTKDLGVENEPNECTYDVWGTTEDGDEFRLSVCEYVDA